LRGAEDVARLGDVRLVRPRETEVRQLGALFGGDDHVVGLEVAVDDAAVVDVPDGKQQLGREVDCARGR
jgi:hypothetical protein